MVIEAFHHVTTTEDAVVVVVEVRTFQITSHHPSPMVGDTVLVHVYSNFITLCICSAVNRGCVG